MSSDFGVYRISGSVEPIISASLLNALEPPSGNINLRRLPERIQRDEEEVDLSRSVYGNSHVFVIPELSSSHHEISSRNSFLSGSELIEDGPVTVYADRYFSKQSKLRKYTYYLTASSGMPGGLVVDQEREPATDEYNFRGINFDATSGSFRNRSIFNPAVFSFDVPRYGKIRDVKVWIELVHDHRGGPGTGSFTGNPFLSSGSGDPNPYSRQGLQGLQIALRSPNVSFPYAHPLWNDRTVSSFPKWSTTQSLDASVYGVPELLRSSYLLWAGHSCEEDLGMTLGSHTSSLVAGDYTIRDINSSSFGPGISGALPTVTGTFAIDLVPSYTLLSQFPAFRTLDSVTIGGSTIGVMYPSRTGSVIPTTQHMLFALDAGTFSGNFPQSSLLIFQSASYDATFGQPLKLSSPRLRVQKNTPFIHAACLGPGTEIRYGIRQAGDVNTYPWRIKAPITVSGNVEYFPTGPAGDSFFDFALDSNGKPHFVANAWRGDMGVSEIKYWFFSGSTADYDAVPAGTTFVDHAADGVYPKNYDFYQRATSGSDLYPDMMFGVLDNSILNNPNQSSNKPGSVGAYCQIEIDKNDTIHVVYSDTANKRVKYAKKPVAYASWSGSWSFELIPSVTSSVSSVWPTYISMDLDKQGNPHVVWAIHEIPPTGSILDTQDALYYAHSGSGGWVIEKIDRFKGLKLGTKLKLDNDDVPVITTTALDHNGKGDESVLIYRSGSNGWDYKLLYSRMDDDPRSTTLSFDNSNRVRAYSAGRRLTAMWQVFEDQDGMYFDFDTDIDMRTVFSDSSPNLNPRNLTKLYRSATDSSPGESERPGLLIVDSHAHSSPFSSSLGLLSSAGVWGPRESRIFRPSLNQTAHLTGANVPWMFDNRIPPGIFHGLDYFARVSSSLGWSPPAGWLTGPGGANTVDEWPTTGSNLGPTDIQPVYPLLDDIYVEKIYDQPSLTGISGSLPEIHNRIVGFRPGLRGTEMNGRWDILIGNAGMLSGSSFVGHPRAGFWFRQARLEFLVDEGEDLREMFPSHSRRFAKKRPFKPGRHRIAILSGSSSWDTGVNYVYVNASEDHGRSFGIADSTGSVDVAVLSRLSERFSEKLASSGSLESVRSSFLNNEFGTPYVPISSGSTEVPTINPLSPAEISASRFVVSEILNPTTLVPNNNNFSAVVSRAGVIVSSRDKIERLLLPTSSSV